MALHRVLFKFFCWTFVLIFAVACAPKKKKADPTPAAVEEAYCVPTNLTYTDAVVITGTAHFHTYTATSNGLITGPEKTARFVEVHLHDSAGTKQQCAETDSLGVFSFQVPRPSGTTTFIVQVLSRANNSQVKASILKDIDTKSYYSISGNATINATSGTVMATMSAELTGEIPAGAFNILDQVLITNEYLRANTTTASCSNCQAFTVAPKVTIYWKKGFTPAAYAGLPDTGLSFFDINGSIEATPSLYILGGINGDVANSDSDQFDNSVIIHEYGHFLEATYSQSDSPGGSHNGNMIIDPRLAWSEGFANFLPSAVTGSTFYIDTIGNPTGITKASIYLNLEVYDGSDGILVKTPVGEGIYREISVSRALLDYIDSNADTIDDGVGGSTTEPSNLSFAYLWKAFTDSDVGIKKSSWRFRSMGHFNEALKTVLTNLSLTTELANFQKIRRAEYQTDDQSEFGLFLTTNSSSMCTKTMTPTKNLSVSANLQYPNLFTSSDFFAYAHAGGSFTLSLNYTPASEANSPDLDLYIFKEDYVVDESETLVGAADKTRSTESPKGTETVTISSLPAGNYMIMVKAYTTVNFSGGSATYDLKIGSDYLCP
jgi:hypothetical protein